MTVALEGTTLHNIQESRLESEGNVRVDSVFGENSHQALLTGMESVEDINLTGKATGLKLSGSSPRTALAQWVAQLEAYVNGNQGTGWSLVDDNRGRTFNVVIKNVGWQINEGAPYEVDWDLEAIWGRGMQPSRSPSPASVNPGQTTTLAGRELPGIMQTREQKSQEIEAYPVAFAEQGENETLSGTGAMKRIIIHGQHPGSNTVRNDFDEAMYALVGQDNTVTYSSSFPGWDLTVMVASYEGTREAGVTDMGEYIVDMWEGTGGVGPLGFDLW